MKKTLIAMAALAASSASFAQVTITGTVMMGFDATHHSVIANPLNALGNPTSKPGVIGDALKLNANGKPYGDSSGLGVDTAEINFRVIEDLGGGYRAIASMQLDTVARSGVTGGDTTMTLVTPVGAFALQSIKVADWLSNGPASIGQLGMDGRTNSSRGFQDVAAFVTKLAPTTTITLSHGENAQFGATTAGLGLGTGAAGAASANTGGFAQFGQMQRNNGIGVTYMSGALVASAQYLNYDQSTDGYDLSIKNVTRAQASYDFGSVKVFGGAISTGLGGGNLFNGVLALGVPAGSWYFTGSYNNSVLSGTSGYLGPIFAQPVTALGGASIYQALGCSNTTGCGAGSLDSNTSGYTLSAQYNFSKSTNAVVSYRNWAFNVNAVDRDSEFEIALVKNF
ncbi:porin [Rhodoferax saidenbachensis]|uniref:Uncharacterized protein n=1 Tax=Rhodoferax saidenbachensis TaxID=1484693 RepID=A0A1P8K705_9BURK|nr:porin [Rhodoferax saidenbachensis]APW41802.1 hypothetical protein RS694_04065 [Rhodoferax saidenbachensis]